MSIDGEGGVPTPYPEVADITSKLWPYGSPTSHYHKVLDELSDANPDATPFGDPLPDDLVDIFTPGLPVEVVKYAEDEDREERFRWNVAKHDVENNTVQWSTVWQKVTVAAGLFKKLGSERISPIQRQDYDQECWRHFASRNHEMRRSPNAHLSEMAQCPLYNIQTHPQMVLHNI